MDNFTLDIIPRSAKAHSSTPNLMQKISGSNEIVNML